MIPGWWTELAASQRLAELRHEADHQLLLRSGRRGGKARRPDAIHGHGWASRIRATRLRSPHRAPWPGPAFLIQRGDRS